MSEIANHPICADCPGVCCQDWEWNPRMNREWQEYLRKIGPEKYLTVAFWQKYMDRANHKQLRVLSVVSVSKGLRNVLLRCQCRHHNAKTGRCGIYKERARTCKLFPNAYNIPRQRGWGCALIDVLSARRAPENFVDFV